MDLGIRKKKLLPASSSSPKKGKQNIVSHSGTEELWSLALEGSFFFFFFFFPFLFSFFFFFVVWVFLLLLF